MYKDNKIGISVPAYNEEMLIDKTLEGIPTFVDKIYVVNDCSSDKTKNIVLERMKNDTRIELSNHNKNEGVGGAIITGFKYALQDGIDIVAVMAGDNQMDPKYLDRLIDPIIESDTEFTKANRLKKGYWDGMSKFRLMGNYLLSIINKIVSGYWGIFDSQNGYVAIKTDSLRKIDLDNTNKWYNFENDLMVRANVHRIKMKNVPIPARYATENSGIVYPRFIFRSIVYFIKAFFWRITNKYFKKKT